MLILSKIDGYKLAIKDLKWFSKHK
jgi:hypothetical protein